MKRDMSSILEVRDVKKSYRLGRILVAALRGVSFDVKRAHYGACAKMNGIRYNDEEN